jgi:hypothetical protein
MAVIVVDGTAYRAMLRPVVFGDYLQTSQGLLLVDGVVHYGGNRILDCVRASEESVAWANALLAATGVMRVIELTKIDPSQSNQSDW